MVETANDYVLDDMASYENPLQYTKVALSTLNSLDTAAINAGILDAEMPEEITEKKHQIWRYMIYSSGPGGRDHQQGNAHSHVAKYYPSLEVAREFNDEEMLWAATNGRQGSEPKFTSIPFMQSKKYAMRSSWDKDALYLFTNADGGENHQHNDDLAMSMFAYGQYLIADAAYNGSVANDANKWMQSTQGHSTVIVDGSEQDANSKGSGIQNAWGSNNQYDFVSLSTKAYRGTKVTPTRNILFVKPGFWIVSDYLKTEGETEEHKYEQRWLLMPEANPTVDTETKAITTHFEGANVRIVPVESDKIKGYDTSEEFLEDGYIGGGTGVMSSTKYVDFEQSAKGNAVYNTILFPTMQNRDYDIHTEEIKISDVKDNGASAFKMSVHDEKNSAETESQYYILHDKAQKAQRVFGDYTFDGQLAYIDKKNDALQNVIVRDYADSESGMEIKDNFLNKTILKTTAPYEGLSMKYNGSTLEIETNIDISDDLVKDVSVRDIDLTTLTAYVPYKMARVKLNGESVQFKQQGCYVYFGDEPIIEDYTEVPDVPGNGGSNSGSDNVHGGGTGGSPGGSNSGGTGGSSGGSSGGSNGGTTDIPKPDSKLTPQMEKELENHWGKTEITNLVNNDIVKGSDNGSLNLEGNVTRAEFVTMLSRAMEVSEKEYNNEFSDVTANDWYAGYIAAAAEAGWIEGADGAAMPNDMITREQMAKILVNVCEWKNKGEIAASGESIEFADGADISDWARDAVNEAVRRGLIKGFEDGTFKPRENARRDAAMVVISRLMQL